MLWYVGTSTDAAEKLWLK